MSNPSLFTKKESDSASFAPVVRDLVRNGTSTGGDFLEIAIPTGCNRCEIICAVSNGAAGDLLVHRSIQRERSAGSEHVQGLAATLAYNVRGARTVLELPPGAGVLRPSQTGLPALATMQATAIFWRQN